MTPESAAARRLRTATEAAHWVQRLEGGTLSRTEREEFVDWLRESPVHVAEALRSERLAAALRDFDWSRIAPADARDGDVVVAFAATPAGLRKRSERQARTPARRRAWFGGIAAAIALTTVAGVLLRERFDVTKLQTRPDERREIALADGSVVRLSPSTELQVRLRAKLRAVTLERGEAVFRVAKDHTRPFVVSAARTRVQAVGTVFAVARNADAVFVTVTEGRVAVTPLPDRAGSNAAPTPSIALQANERLAVSPVGIASEIRRIDAPRQPEWSDNQLVFENARVAEIVARFNRHNRLQIRIADPALASRAISGIFDVDDPRSFVEFLATVAGASGRNGGPDEIIVSARATGTGPVLPAR